MKVTSAVVLLILLTMTSCARVRNHQYSRRQGSPVEAIEACEGKQVANSVEFTGRNGETIKASCQEINGQLVAVPDRMTHGGDRSK